MSPEGKSPVHPRACGEQSSSYWCFASRAGSSPRVRGTVNVCAALKCHLRFIPARAGNSRVQLRILPWVPVHPRACGEQIAIRKSDAVWYGSSPRVRGTDRDNPAGPERNRFIPARAGNSTSSGCAPTSTAVHPRACGEQAEKVTDIFCQIGSSPRVRGTDRDAPGTRVRDRFIPARAGNRRARRVWTRALPVHPRACGEQAATEFFGQAKSGSSPRVRGTVRGDPLSRSLVRFIPARAGNSTNESSISVCQSVHPRACGEQALSLTIRQAVRGSSPRVRGTA